MIPIDDINYDITSKLYLDLIIKIKNIKKQGGYLLIKMNSHPCAGKTTFIRKYSGNYSDYALMHFDKYRGEDKSSTLLLKMKKNSVLLGCSGGGVYSQQWNHDMDLYDNIIYIFVIPKLINLYKNIVHRQLISHEGKTEGWSNSVHIIKYRNNMYSHILKGNVQIKPLFYSFKEALDFCIKAYDE